MEDISQVCSVWVGSETGILKGVSLSKKQAFNFCEMNCLSREQEVCVLGWGDPQETEVLVGSVNGTVKWFRTEKGIITTVGINVGKNVCRMRQNPSQCNQVAAGGKENGLKAWDPERPGTPVFTSKNVRNDWLDLRVPEWVRDMAFIADSDKIDTCTGQHQVCLSVFPCTSPVLRLGLLVFSASLGVFPCTQTIHSSGVRRILLDTQPGQRSTFWHTGFCSAQYIFWG